MEEAYSAVNHLHQMEELNFSNKYLSHEVLTSSSRDCRVLAMNKNDLVKRFKVLAMHY